MEGGGGGRGGAGDHFKKGEQVEVCFDEEGFRGSWYSATVLRALKLSNRKNLSYKKIHLQFHTLFSENDESKRHRQYVDFLLVRPVPPREPHRSFQLGEEVDAFHNDGWWEGFIINVLPPLQPAGPTRYSIYFRGSRELIVFPEHDIRLHREWVYGHWVPPLEPEPEPVPPQHPAPQHSSLSSSPDAAFSSSRTHSRQS